MHVIHHAGVPVGWNGMIDNFSQGFQCWLYGTTPESPAGSVASQPWVGCTDAPLLVNLYMLVNVSYNILLVLILKQGSAIIVVLASAIIIPTANLAFSFHWIMGAHAVPVRVDDILALSLVIVGKKKKKKTKTFLFFFLFFFFFPFLIFLSSYFLFFYFCSSSCDVTT